MGSYHLEPSHPSLIRLFSDSSTSSNGPTPPPIQGRGFIRTCAVPYGGGCARGGGRGDDASGGYGNGYLSFGD